MGAIDINNWYSRPITQEELMTIFKKALKEHLKYTYSFCIGFIDTKYYKEDGDSHIWVGTDDAPTQNGKRFVLMKAGSHFHKYLLKLEEEEDIHFERLTDETMQTILSHGLVIFTNEDGSYHNLSTYKPTFMPMEEALEKWNIPIGYYYQEIQPSIPFRDNETKEKPRD